MGEWGDKQRGCKEERGGSETKAGEQVCACAAHCVGPLSAESGVFCARCSSAHTRVLATVSAFACMSMLMSTHS